ncbi:Arginase [Wickerhamiella sorbophila]|uniref:Arginase n=1 Tax=Wickerhamiella sorbophila TaxID=45607 RepID=A0A2T0FJV9_9ASCO|nr:Arginase [Wickerhamiella sorbophila]PRT55272.1 Arginase [Wickerhamiella sorbophila]
MQNKDNKELYIVGAPFAGGQGKQGVDEAPKLLLREGLETEIQNLGWNTHVSHLEFEEVKNDTPISNMKNPRFVSKAAEKVYDSVKAAAEKGFVLTVGGDHSIGAGTVAGVLAAHPEAVVLWIDAHADINTPAATQSGNIHGCPLSFPTGIDELPEDVEDGVFKWLPRKSLDFSRLAYIGLRDADEFEKSVIRKYNIAAYSMHDVDKYGIARVVEMALRRVNPGNTRPIHLSFDVDALDPFFAPSTGTPVRGGLTWREGCYICEAVAETGNLVAMDLVECNPHLGEHDEHIKSTLHSGIALVKSALGQTLL